MHSFFHSSQESHLSDKRVDWRTQFKEISKRLIQDKIKPRQTSTTSHYCERLLTTNQVAIYGNVAHTLMVRFSDVGQRSRRLRLFSTKHVNLRPETTAILLTTNTKRGFLVSCILASCKSGESSLLLSPEAWTAGFSLLVLACFESLLVGEALLCCAFYIPFC